MRIIIFFGFSIFTIAVFLIGGCAARVPRDPSTTALVFGYIDMSEAQGRADIDHIKLARRVPASRRPEIVRGRIDYNDGVSMQKRPGNFWAYNLLPGTYQISEFGGTFVGVGSGVTLFGANGSVSGTAPYHIFKLPTDQDNATTIQVDKPGLYFMGSFKLVPHGRQFELVKVDAPTEQDVLKRLLYRNRVPYWKPIIEQRQADLAAAGKHDKKKISKK